MPKDMTFGRLTRRDFMRLGLPLLSASLILPSVVWAEIDPIAEKLSALGGSASPVPPAAQADGAPVRKPRMPRLVMIDPGHGGHDPGAIGTRGTREKDITLDIGLRMMDLFAAQQAVHAKLTRQTDMFVPLPERVQQAQVAKADLFISIHADSAPGVQARGLSAYTLSEQASDAFSKQLATQENRIEAMGAGDAPSDREVAAILMDLTARRTRVTSQKVRYEFVQNVGRRWHLLEHPMRDANFAVLRAPDVPSILVETGFLSNPQDEGLLRTADQRQLIAEIMTNELIALLTGDLFA